MVLGANGQVGHEALRALASLGTVFAATRDGAARDDAATALRIDVSDAVDLRDTLDRIAPDVIVNAAAYTAVDRAEDEPEAAERLNHHAVEVIGAWAARRDALVVHYSTDYVFDGNAHVAYREDAATAPLGVYGRSKLAGEEALRASGAAHLIFRTAWVYAARGSNFLLTMLRLANARDELRVVADQVGAPTPARAIADATALAVAHWRAADTEKKLSLNGVYHLVSAGHCSWFDFACAIMQEAEALDLVPRVPRMLPITSSEYPTRARRPAWSVLDCGRFESTFGIHLPDWREGMRSVLAELARQRQQVTD